MHSAVVVLDPRPNPLPAGTVVHDAKVDSLESLGVVLLPVESFPLNAQRAALRQYHLRLLGEQGVPLIGDTPNRCCGMALEHEHDLPYVHWLVGVVATGPNPRASVSLAADPGNGMYQQGSLDLCTPRAVLEPFELTMPGDWDVLGGRARLTLSNQGLAGFSLTAMGNDVAIAWCAVSQCAEPRHLKCLDR